MKPNDRFPRPPKPREPLPGPLRESDDWNDDDLRLNPSRKRKIKPDDLTLGEIQEVSQRMQKLRKHFLADIDDEIRRRLRELLRKNPDATIEDYLDGAADQVDDDEDEADAA